jgi:hypothetical protein
MRTLLLVLSLCVLAASSSAQNTNAENNLLRFGDFETPSTQNPPPGWVMWGAEQSKNPQNYTRDQNTFHSGAASLRIHHPANTTGYIVTSVRDNALTTKKGVTYQISFWAKADKAGTALFQVQGFSSIEPFADYSSPLNRNIQVSTEWQKFTFPLTESLDFFADSARHLMLAFSAVGQGASELERTLWIDDVAVEEKPSLFQITLFNPATVDYNKVQHRLSSGDALNITVDAKRRLRPTVRAASAVSWHRVKGYMNLPYNGQGQYKLTPEQETSIRAMHLPHTRFYGVGEEPFSLEDTIDKAAHTLERTGTPQGGTVLEFEEQGAQRRLAPEVWARGVRHSVNKGYKFRHWEVANEPWIHHAGRDVAFPTPEDYIAHVKSVGAAIRKVQPGAQIGVGLQPMDLRWGNQIIRQAAGHYDFVAGHWYSFIDAIKNPFEMVTAGENYRILDQMSRFNALLKAYNPGREVYQYDTEWSLHSSAAGSVLGTKQNGNIVGSMHRAVRLIYYLREDIVRGASAWEMFSGLGAWNSLGVLSPDSDKKTMLYWTHRTFNEHLGDHVLDMQGTTPYYQPTASTDRLRPPLTGPLAPAIVMLSNDERTLTAIIANASWSQSVPCTLRINNFNVRHVSGIKLSHDDPNAPPLLERKEDFVSDFPVKVEASTLNCTLPPHSIAFITLRK